MRAAGLLLREAISFARPPCGAFLQAAHARRSNFEPAIDQPAAL
jgi:hypothetical protein